MADIKKNPVPITPEEAINDRINHIHPDIINVTNELIAAKISSINSSVRILQKEIIEGFMIKNPDFERKKLTEDHHLDIEGIYRKYGWKVVYDKPAYNETYEASFTFTKNKKNED